MRHHRVDRAVLLHPEAAFDLVGRLIARNHEEVAADGQRVHALLDRPFGEVEADLSAIPLQPAVAVVMHLEYEVGALRQQVGDTLRQMMRHLPRRPAADGAAR